MQVYGVRGRPTSAVRRLLHRWSVVKSPPPPRDTAGPDSDRARASRTRVLGLAVVVLAVVLLVVKMVKDALPYGNASGQYVRDALSGGLWLAGGLTGDCSPLTWR